MSQQLSRKLTYFREPQILFGHGQLAEDPRDGLTLFGPHESPGDYTLQIGIVGTLKGIAAYSRFVDTMTKPILSTSSGRPPFPGFEEVFGIKWPCNPVITRVVEECEIQRLLDIPNLKERTYALSSVFMRCILDARDTEDKPIHLWYIVLPREVWLNCRPKSYSKGQIPEDFIQEELEGQSYLFDEVAEDVERCIAAAKSDSDFHDQMKARAIAENVGIPLQIILEPTLDFRDKYRGEEYNTDMKAHLAWTQSTAVYYKAGYLPWRLSQIRDGVCYLGIVYKSLENIGLPGYACSAAQMFLDSGDGTVFRGNNGPWQSHDGREYHLNREASRLLLAKALDSYIQRTARHPKEVFLHARAQFHHDEWCGFLDAVRDRGLSTRLVGVVIKPTRKLKLFRDLEGFPNRYGILRGLAYILDDKEAFLWTRGFVPRLSTSTSLEVPNPLRIQVRQGTASIEQVIKDILCLTKVNYNSCLFGDGLPVTLRFSDNVGDILTALRDVTTDVLPFKYYI